MAKVRSFPSGTVTLFRAFLESATYDVRPALVSLLSDPEVSVRLEAAVYFAQRQDAVCALALWELMKHAEDLEPWQHSSAAQAIHSLTGGSYFGFTPGTVSTPEVRKATLQRFARWIEDRGGH